MIKIYKNKRGYSLGGWIEGILFSLLVVSLIIIVAGGMNQKYGKDNQIGIGGNTTTSALINYQGSAQTQTTEGEAVFTSTEGLTLKSLWGMLKGMISIIWDFLSGGWIETICSWMKLPLIVSTIFRVLYFISIVLIIITIFQKVKP